MVLFEFRFLLEYEVCSIVLWLVWEVFLEVVLKYVYLGNLWVMVMVVVLVGYVLGYEFGVVDFGVVYERRWVYRDIEVL